MYCRFCGAPLLAGAMFCTGCGNRLQEVNNVRRQFALTYVFALMTGIFWICQWIWPVWSFSLFGPLVSLLSWVARISFITSYIRASKNWLAVSAIARTSSMTLWILGGLPFGTGPWVSWPDLFTAIFSVSTLVTYFIQAKKAGVRPYVIERKPVQGPGGW